MPPVGVQWLCVAMPIRAWGSAAGLGGKSREAEPKQQFGRGREEGVPAPSARLACFPRTSPLSIRAVPCHHHRLPLPRAALSGSESQEPPLPVLHEERCQKRAAAGDRWPGLVLARPCLWSVWEADACQRYRCVGLMASVNLQCVAPKRVPVRLRRPSMPSDA